MTEIRTKDHSRADVLRAKNFKRTQESTTDLSRAGAGAFTSSPALISLVGKPQPPFPPGEQLSATGRVDNISQGDTIGDAPLHRVNTIPGRICSRAITSALRTVVPIAGAEMCQKALASVCTGPSRLSADTELCIFNDPRSNALKPLDITSECTPYCLENFFEKTVISGFLSFLALAQIFHLNPISSARKRDSESKLLVTNFASRGSFSQSLDFETYG